MEDPRELPLFRELPPFRLYGGRCRTDGHWYGSAIDNTAVAVVNGTARCEFCLKVMGVVV